MSTPEWTEEDDDNLVDRREEWLDRRADALYDQAQEEE